MSQWIKRAWLDLPLRQKGLVVVALPVLALLGASLAIYSVDARVRSIESWFDDIAEERTTLQSLGSALVDSLAAVRSFATTGRRESLAPLSRANASVPRLLARLRILVKSDPSQMARLETAESLINETLKDLNRVLADSGASGQFDLTALTAKAAANLQQVGRVLTVMYDTENRLLAEHVKARVQTRKTLNIAMGANVGLGILCALLGATLFGSGVARRIQRVEENARLLSSGQKLTNVDLGRDEIARLDEALHASEHELDRRAAELEQSQLMLREQVRLLESVLSSIGDGVVVGDQHGKFTIFNPAAERILGAPAADTDLAERSRHYGLFLPDKKTLIPAGDQPLERAIRGENVDAIEFYVCRPQWQEGRWLSATARPLLDDLGSPAGGVVVFRDVTSQKLNEELLQIAKDRAENSDRAKSMFLSRMSHELRTPLNSILGFGQLLEMYDLESRHKECVHHIMKGARHLLGLIDEVLDIARIEAGKLTISPEPVLIADALQDAIDMVRPVAERNGIRLDNTLPPLSEAHVIADRQRLRQVLLNLLSNAVKFNREGGSVSLRCERAGEHIQIGVSDTGDGISPSDQEKLFAPFERLSANRTGIEGTGLGLALSKGLVEIMGGSLRVVSEVGSGSTFWIELQATDAPSDHALRQGMLSEVEIKGSEIRRTVLYVEDNVSNLRLIEQVFTFRPHLKLLPAMQGRLGLDLAFEHRPDIILLDLHLPDINGDEILKILQGDPRTCHIPTVMVSADATPGQVLRLKAAGAREYITKPIDVSNLLNLLDGLLADSTLQAVPASSKASSIEV